MTQATLTKIVISSTTQVITSTSAHIHTPEEFHVSGWTISPDPHQKSSFNEEAEDTNTNQTYSI